MNQQNKALTVAIICICLFIIVGAFLYSNFSKIDREGVACMSQPLLYAENVLEEANDEDYTCDCVEKEKSYLIGAE